MNLERLKDVPARQLAHSAFTSLDSLDEDANSQEEWHVAPRDQLQTPSPQARFANLQD